MTPFSPKNFKSTLHEIFEIEKKIKLEKNTDLSIYIQDSIDLGELISVLKNRYNVVPKNLEFFRTHTQLEEIYEHFIPIT